MYVWVKKRLAKNVINHSTPIEDTMPEDTVEAATQQKDTR